MEPTLGDILSVNADPELGGGVPSTLFDNRQLIQTVNQNAQFQAQNAWNRYTVFQDNLSNLYQNIGDVSKLEVATEDREALDKDRKELFDTIWQSPKEFFGSGNAKRRADIEAKLNKYRSSATESKLNKTFDMAHRTFIGQNPELDTDENKQIVDQYLKQPLGSRKAYTLNMPTIFDYGKFSQDILKTPGVTKTTLKNEYSPDNKFIQEYQQTSINKDAFMRNWMTGLLGTDKYGHSQRTWAEQQFKKLTPDQKSSLDVKSPEDFWKVLGEQTFGSEEDIVTSEKGKTVANPFELEMVKAQGRLSLLNKRYGLMAGIEAIKQGNRKDLEQFKVDIRGLSPDDQNQALNNLTEGLVDDAISSGDSITVNGKTHFKMKTSDVVLNMFAKGSGILKQTPDDIVVSPDGESLMTIYYKDKEKGEIDYDKSRSFTKDELKVDLGKDIFGTAGVRKMANIKPSSGSKKPVAPTSTNKWDKFKVPK